MRQMYTFLFILRRFRGKKPPPAEQVCGTRRGCRAVEKTLSTLGKTKVRKEFSKILTVFSKVLTVFRPSAGGVARGVGGGAVSPVGRGSEAAGQWKQGAELSRVNAHYIFSFPVGELAGDFYFCKCAVG